MKFLLVICFAAVFGAVTAGVNTRIGKIGPYDELLHTQRFNVPHRDGEVQKTVIEYSGNATITDIVIQDIWDGSSPNVRLIEGGVSYKNVTIELEGIGTGIYGLVNIFGKV